MAVLLMIALGFLTLLAAVGFYAADYAKRQRRQAGRRRRSRVVAGHRRRSR